MKPKSQNQATRFKKALNLTLIILGSSIALLAAYVIFILVTSPFMPAGYGDIILFAVPLMLGVGLASIAYIVMVIIYSIQQVKKKTAQSKLHLIAAIAILVIGLLPSIGPIRLIYAITLQPVIGSVSKSIKDSQFEGPTSAQIESKNLQAFDKAQALFDGCNVSSILYWRFDTDGPFTEENSYIIVQARNNGTVAYGPAPPDVNLPASDKEKLKTAMKDYSKGPYPACELKIEWRNENRFSR